MSFLAFCGSFPAFALGRISVRWKNHGCAAFLSACAGGLLASGLSSLPEHNGWTAAGFLPALCLFCLRWSALPESGRWRAQWAERGRRAYGWTAITALLCGILHRWLPIALLCAVHGTLTRLNGASPARTIRLPIAWTVLCGVGFALSSLLSGPVSAGLLCGLCLCLAAWHVLPAAQSLCCGEQNAMIAVLFVFLFYYYTNCIL